MNITQEDVRECLEIALKQTIDEFSQNIRKNVLSNVYGTPEKKYYKRTGDFLRAVSSPSLNINGAGDFYIEWYDTDKIKSKNGVATRSKFGNYYMLTFGAHRSWPWDNPKPSDSEVRENLYDWLNDGFTILGKRYHSGYNFDIDTEFSPGKDFYNRFIELGIKEIKILMSRK